MNYKRIFELFPYQMARFPQPNALATKKDGKWQNFSTSDCIAWINKVSASLLDMGLEKGDAIAIISETGTPFWNFIDFGAQQIGLIPVPIHAVASNEQIQYILQEANVRVIFCANTDLYEKAILAQQNKETQQYIYNLEKNEQSPYWEDILTEVTETHLDTIKKIKQTIGENDLATIIYTSGTSGQPKGVMLSHRNIISNIKAAIALIPVNCDKRTISFLPLSHVFERVVTYAYIAVGASVHYATAIDTLMDELKEVRPHYFTTVPRIVEKLYDGISDIGHKKGGWKKKVIHWGIRIGAECPISGRTSALHRFQLFWADLFLYRKWRQVLGGKVEGIMVGASALQPKLGRFFESVGIPIREGYGLTETSPVLTFNRFEPGGVQFGTVGIPIPGVEIKIATPDKNGTGEILARGPNVMMGYYKKPKETAKVIDAAGWFRTGDVGLFVQKRFLKITGRKKDIFKTSSGKYVAPEFIGQKVMASPYIEYALIVGFHRPYVGALLVPNYEKLEEWCLVNNVHWTAPQFMAINPKVIKFMESIIKEVNTSLSNAEKIKKFTLLHKDWSTTSGEITPTLKLRRNFIVEKYNNEIEELYK